MTVSISVVDDEPDVAELFRQRFQREAPLVSNEPHTIEAE
jgi:hypothetical protein